jgi:nitrite reductase/ring-hydroxylating ferredoxin subunit
MANLTKVAEIKEIAPGTAKQVEVGGKNIAVFNLNGTFYAMDDACTHRGGPLSEGAIEGDLSDLPLAWGKLQYQNGRGKESARA